MVTAYFIPKKIVELEDFDQTATLLNKHVLTWNGDKFTPTFVSFLDLINNPTTLAGYGIIDGTTLTQFYSHANRTDNPHRVTKQQIGLSDVTNDAQVKRSEIGQPGGVASLDQLGNVSQPTTAIRFHQTTSPNVPTTSLGVGEPLYVTDVQEFRIGDGNTFGGTHIGFSVVTPPSTSTSIGIAGQVAYDGTYFYMCVSRNTWLRTPLAKW